MADVKTEEKELAPVDNHVAEDDGNDEVRIRHNTDIQHLWP